MKGATITIRLRREGLYLQAGFTFVMAEVVVAEKLVKNYDEFRAVDSIGFSIHQGECFGFLGPNGAGKSTTMRMIHCASPLTSGRLSVLDMDVQVEPRRIKALIGVAPQENNLDPDFSVIKNLTVYARYFNMDKAVALKRSEELLEFMQLTEKRDEMMESLSGGMKRRLIIARALINEPRILILDEPTTGLDPQARHLIWERIRELKRKGVTVILTTHYMDEAEKLCDRLVIMDKGKIVVEGTPRKLIEERVGAEVVEIDEPRPRGGGVRQGEGPGLRADGGPPAHLLTLLRGPARRAAHQVPAGIGHHPPRHPGGRLPPLDRQEADGMSLVKNISWRCWAVWQRNKDVFLKTWKTNFLPPFLEPILYLVAMGLGFGVLINDLVFRGETITYIQFLAPGLLAISIMYGAFFECTYGSFVRMHYQKTFDAMVATPLTIEDVIAGEILWGATKSLINTTIVLVVITAFGLADFPGLVFVPVIAFLGGMMFASLAMIFTGLGAEHRLLQLPVLPADNAHVPVQRDILPPGRSADLGPGSGLRLAADPCQHRGPGPVLQLFRADRPGQHQHT